MKFKVGDKVVIVDGKWPNEPRGHSFYIGEVVKIKEILDIGTEWKYNCWNLNETDHWFCREKDLELVEENNTQSTKGSSDGGPSDYYDFPQNCTTLNDLIEYKNMSFAHGNIFKAAYRLGHKEGISLEYDLNKIIYYANRMLDQLKKKEGK